MVGNKPMPGHPMYDEWYKRWPHLYDFTTDPSKVGEENCLFTQSTYLSNNSAIGGKIHESETISRFMFGGNNNEYTDKVNPLFVNPSIGDYRIRDDADFHKIPFENIGRY